MYSHTFWILFHVFIGSIILFDLFAHRVVKRKDTATYMLSFLWIALGLGFTGYLYSYDSSQNALAYLNGYLIEKTLSIDNIFAFYLIFKNLQLPIAYQRNVLILGIMGALLLRVIFITSGIIAIEHFHILLPIMGGILLWMSYQFWNYSDKNSAPLHRQTNWLHKKINIHPTIKGPGFFIWSQQKLFFTTSFLAFIYVETADILFAIDSIPAILAFTLDAKIVYLSNVFAILGLRSLYFLIANASQKFRSLHYGISFLLFFAGLKMIFKDIVTVPNILSLAMILLTLLGSIIFDLRKNTSK